ncbi:hypothetical protein [Salsuginibacillus kocurii]|uniref:hypothetical protein n=1 Tax=Salsuginibacillus kocurii TaxID=427078 RepID=UPI0003690191|nr:hypothetical protein [Salsuginibacillus kocurii]
MKIETYRTQQWKMEGREEGKKEGIQEGREEGIREGKEKGKREEKAAMLISFLQTRFPDEVTKKAVGRVQTCADIETLEKIQSHLFKADTWEEVESVLKTLEV